MHLRWKKVDSHIETEIRDSGVCTTIKRSGKRVEKKNRETKRAEYPETPKDGPVITACAKVNNHMRIGWLNSKCFYGKVKLIKVPVVMEWGNNKITSMQY